MKRREFFISTAAVALARSAWGQASDKAKLDRIAVMSLCFGRTLKGTSRPNRPTATLEVMDLGAMLAEKYGIHRVEFQHSDFASTETAYLQEFRDRMKKTDSQFNQINLEFGDLNISTPDPSIRLQTIELTKSWIDHAGVLGCPRVMVNQGNLAPEVRQSAIETLKTMNAYGKANNVAVTMEPRNAPWEVVVEVIKASGIAANPDGAHFPDKEARAAGLAVMYRMTAGSSHVNHVPEQFDTAEGIKIANSVGYKGIFSLEASAGSNTDPDAAMKTVLDIVLASI
jgi:hypothetical protein